MKMGHDTALAVLPFVNVTATPAIDTLGYDVAEQVRDVLRFGRVVRVTDTVIPCDGTHDVSFTQIGRELDADWLVFGCVCLEGGKLHAHTQLVHVRTGRIARLDAHDHVVEGRSSVEVAARIAVVVAEMLNGWARS